MAVNADTNITDGSRYRSVVTYKCFYGYVKEKGSFRRECVANETHAMWTGSTLACKRMYDVVNFLEDFIMMSCYVAGSILCVHRK